MRWGANVQERTRSGTMRASYAHSGKDHQLGLGTAGTLALHSGGVTYGPYASDTFALVEAKGASGARINNAQGARIDVFGYGIAPSLAPYRYNTISIDGNSRPGCRAGRRKRTRGPGSGRGAESGFQHPWRYPCPDRGHDARWLSGTDGCGGSGPGWENIGMAGQNGQVYARLPDASGTLFIRWDSKQTCRVNYQMPARNKASGNNFIHLNGICVQ